MNRDKGTRQPALTIGRAPVCADGFYLHDGQLVTWESLSAGKYLLRRNILNKQDVVFARFSTMAQVRNGCSIQQQVEAALNAVSTRGRVLSCAYIDPGQSATHRSFSQRPGVSALLADIKAGKVGVVYVYKRDRIARKTHEWIQFLRLCAKYSVEIAFTCPGEVPPGHGAYGQFVESIVIAIAQLEAEVTGVRVRDGHLQRLKAGRWPGGNLPFGYRRTKERTIALVEEEAQVVREIFRLAITEDLGMRRIARWLNEQFPNSRRGKTWTPHDVLKILNNRTYCGYVHIRISQHDGSAKSYVEHHSSELPALVSEVDWKLAQAARVGRKPKPGLVPKYGSGIRLLSGIAVCGLCGSPMYTRGSVTKYRRLDGRLVTSLGARYRCIRGQNRAGCEYTSEISTTMVDTVVSTAVQEQLARLDIAGLIEAAVQNRIEACSRLREEQNRLKEEVERLSRDLDIMQRELEESEGGAGAEQHQRQVRALLEAWAGYQRRNAQIKDRVPSLMIPSDEELALQHAQAWPNGFGEIPLERQRETLVSIVRQVRVFATARKLDVVFRFQFPLEGQYTDTLSNVPIPRYTRRR